MFELRRRCIEHPRPVRVEIAARDRLAVGNVKGRAERALRFRREDRVRAVVHVDEVEPLLAIAYERFALQERLLAKQAVRPVNAREAQHDRLGNFRTERALRFEHNSTRVFQWFRRSVFVHPIAIGLAVDAGTGNVKEPMRFRKCRQNIREPLDVDFAHGAARRAVEADRVEHGLGSGQ